ncbi:hypothetical protein [Microcoleus sp. FACHB-831]|nr:hypothetical protein [Microcoleus sp. FACHB-831]
MVISFAVCRLDRLKFRQFRNPLGRSPAIRYLFNLAALTPRDRP